MTPSQKERLQNRDFVLLIDRSGSMDEKDGGSTTRWQRAQETTEQVARAAAECDPDGINVYTFNDQVTSFKNTTPDKVREIFQNQSPSAGTSLAPALRTIFNDYTSRKAKGEVKSAGEMLVVVTDGAPTDGEAAAKEIVNFGNKLDNGDEEYGILFLQIGTDPKASAYLRKLDDDLGKAGAKHDIVDCKTMDELSGMSLGDAFIAALDD